MLVAPAVAGKWVQHFRPGLLPPTLASIAAMVFVAYVVFHLFRFILRAPRVNNEILDAALATYLMLGLLWAFAYMLVGEVNPSSFVVTGETGRSQLCSLTKRVS